MLTGEDPVMCCYDAATERLTPLVAGDLKHPASEARQRWAEHVEADLPELTDMLASLRFRTGRPEAAERQRADLLMRLHGLANDQAAIDAAMALMRNWIRERWRKLSVDELNRRMLDRIPRQSDPWTLFVIEGIDNHNLEAPVTVRLRFVERYEGDDSFSRRQLRDPAEWSGVYAEIAAAADALRSVSKRRVLVAGSMRLPMWFAAGTALRHVRNFTVGTYQTGELWASDTGAVATPIHVGSRDIGRGTDLAVAVSVSNDITEAVAAHVNKDKLAVSKVVSIRPETGPGDQAIVDDRQAVGLAIAVRNAVRDVLDGAGRIHLFISAPAGFTLLLGHRWNALAPTIVYEHLLGSKYAATFTAPA